MGCGDSQFHRAAERELGCGIIGLDRGGRTAICDSAMNFDDFTARSDVRADVVYWLSSIEHNTPEIMARLVERSMNALQPGGLFLATFSYAQETKWTPANAKNSEQSDLSMADAVNVFNAEWVGTPNFDAAVKEYRTDAMALDTRHRARYGSGEYTFVVAGCKKEKR